MTPVATAAESLIFALVFGACLLALAVGVEWAVCDGGACVEASD